MRPLLLLLSLALCAWTGEAQGFSTASGPGAYVAAGAGYSLFAADYGHRTLGGGVAFVDVHPTWRYGVEGEVRVLRQHSDAGATQASLMVGPIVYLRSHRLRPYAKFLVGAGRINFPFGYGQGTYLAYAPGAESTTSSATASRYARRTLSTSAGRSLRSASCILVGSVQASLSGSRG